MKTLLEEYVERLSDEDRHDIIRSYEEFRRDGYTGDTPIRRHARAAAESSGIQTIIGYPFITTMMTSLALECYKYFYHFQQDKR